MPANCTCSVQEGRTIYRAQPSSRAGLALTRRPAQSTLNLHRLVHGALREWLQKRDWLDRWIQNATTQLLRVFPDNDHGRSKWRRLLPHAKYALSHGLAEREGGDRLTLVLECAMTLYSDGRYDEREKLFLQVMDARKRVLRDEHLDTLTIINNLALTLKG